VPSPSPVVEEGDGFSNVVVNGVALSVSGVEVPVSEVVSLADVVVGEERIVVGDDNTEEWVVTVVVMCVVGGAAVGEGGGVVPSL
jgi:hypothetical protein